MCEAGFNIFSSEQMLLRIEDLPGALADISPRLVNAQVDIRSIHFVNKEADGRIVALKTENDYRARQVLSGGKRHVCVRVFMPLMVIEPESLLIYACKIWRNHHVRQDRFW